MSGFICAALHGLPASLPALRDGTRCLNSGQLRQLIAAERSWLEHIGVRRCALLAPNSCAWIIADLALLDSAAVNVPIPHYFTSDQIQHVLEDAALEFVLCENPEHFIAEHPQYSLRECSAQTGLHLLQRCEVRPYGHDWYDNDDAGISNCQGKRFGSVLKT